MRAGNIAQRQSSCLPCVRPRVPSERPWLKTSIHSHKNITNLKKKKENLKKTFYLILKFCMDLVSFYFSKTDLWTAFFCMSHLKEENCMYLHLDLFPFHSWFVLHTFPWEGIANFTPAQFCTFFSVNANDWPLTLCLCKRSISRGCLLM